MQVPAGSSPAPGSPSPPPGHTHKYLESIRISNQLAEQYEVNILNSLSAKKVIQNINEVLDIRPSNSRLSPKAKQSQSGDSFYRQMQWSNAGKEREKYANLIAWHHSTLAQIKKFMKEESFGVYSSIHKQQEVLCMAMGKFIEYVAEECEEKGTLMRIFMTQHFNLHFSLVEHLQYKMNENLTEKITVENQMEQSYDEEIRKLKEELDSLTHEKDKKWKNLFMLIKDNRILRRTKGKLMREVQNSLNKQQSLKQNIIELTKENERYKLMFQSGEYYDNGFEKWYKNWVDLAKVEKLISKETLKAKRVLEYELSNLQIQELTTLPDKIQYVIKAIEQAEDLVDFYQDFNDCLEPCKILLNGYTQTYTDTEERGTNTPVQAKTNVYCQAKPHEMLVRKLSLHSKKYSYSYPDAATFENWRKESQKYSQNLRKISNMTMSNKGERFSTMSSPRNFQAMAQLRMRLVRCISETVIAQTVPPDMQALTQQVTNLPAVAGRQPSPKIVASTNKNYLYFDSKFMFKLQLCAREVAATYKGSLGFFIPSVKAKAIAKKEQSPARYNSMQNPSIALHDNPNVNVQSNEPRPAPADVNQDAEPKQIKSLGSKRFSYAANLSLMSKLQKSTNSDYKQNDSQTSQNSQRNSNFLQVGRMERLDEAISEQRSSQSHSSSTSSPIKQKHQRSPVQAAPIQRQKIQDLTRSSLMSVIAKHKNRMKTEPNQERGSVRNLTSIVDVHKKQLRMSSIPRIQARQAREPSEQISQKQQVNEQKGSSKLQRQAKNEGRNISTSPQRRDSTNPKRNSTNPRRDSATKDRPQVKQESESSGYRVARKSFNTNSHSAFKSRTLNKQTKTKQNHQYSLQQNSQQMESSNNQGTCIQMHDKGRGEAMMNTASGEWCEDNRREDSIISESLFNIDEATISLLQNNMKKKKRTYGSQLHKTVSRFGIKQSESVQKMSHTFTGEAYPGRYEPEEDMVSNMSYIAPSNPKEKSTLLNFCELNVERKQGPLLDAGKIINKISHLLFVNRKQLKNSSKSLKQYIECNIKNIYGAGTQYQAFSKSLSLSPGDGSPLVLSFMAMLNTSAPLEYQVDLLKIYLIIMEKAGVESLLVSKEVAGWVIHYLTSIFYNDRQHDRVLAEMEDRLLRLQLQDASSAKTDQKKGKGRSSLVNLNHYFVLLQTRIREMCLQTQFYRFCQEILPENESNLNFPQIKELLCFLPSSSDNQVHLSRIKMYCYKEGKDNETIKNNRINGMKLHKISLYAMREQWNQVADIKQTIERGFLEIKDRHYGLSELMVLVEDLVAGQSGEFLLKAEYPWVHGLMQAQINNHRCYDVKPSKHLLMLVYIAETYLRVEREGILGMQIGLLHDRSKRLIITDELRKFILGNKIPETKQVKEAKEDKQDGKNGAETKDMREVAQIARNVKTFKSNKRFTTVN